MLITFLENARYDEGDGQVKKAIKHESREVAHSTACGLINAKKARESTVADELFNCFRVTDPLMQLLSLENKYAAKAYGMPIDAEERN